MIIPNFSAVYLSPCHGDEYSESRCASSSSLVDDDERSRQYLTKENRLDSLDEIRSFFQFLVEERQNRKAGAIISLPFALQTSSTHQVS